MGSCLLWGWIWPCKLSCQFLVLFSFLFRLQQSTLFVYKLAQLVLFLFDLVTLLHFSPILKQFV